jgi:hypothetical protein
MRDLTVNEIEEVNGGVNLYYDIKWPHPFIGTLHLKPTKKTKTGGGGGYSQYAEYYRDRYSYGNTDFNNGFGYA